MLIRTRGLIDASEADIELVVINGVRRFGTTKNMKGASAHLESLKVGKKERSLNLDNPNTGQLPTVTLAQAKTKLQAALLDLPAMRRSRRT